MDGAVPDVGVCDVADHVEVEWVASKLGRLANVEELNVLDFTDHVLVLGAGVKHDVSSVLVWRRVGVTLEEDVS